MSRTKIWILVDEIIDPCTQFTANVVTGIVDYDQPSKLFLLSYDLFIFLTVRAYNLFICTVPTSIISAVIT